SSYLRGQATGGDGNLACADASSPRRVQDRERFEQILVIGERLAHAHNNEVRDEALRGFASLLSFFFKELALSVPLGRQYLFYNFARRQIAFPAIQTARAKTAPVRAPHLGRNAQCSAVARFPVQ